MSFCGVVLGDAGSSKRCARLSSSCACGGQFSLSGLSCSTFAICTTGVSNQFVRGISQGMQPSKPIPEFSQRPQGRSRSQPLCNLLHRSQRGFSGRMSLFASSYVVDVVCGTGDRDLASPSLRGEGKSNRRVGLGVKSGSMSMGECLLPRRPAGLD